MDRRVLCEVLHLLIMPRNENNNNKIEKTHAARESKTKGKGKVLKDMRMCTREEACNFYARHKYLRKNCDPKVASTDGRAQECDGV